MSEWNEQNDDFLDEEYGEAEDIGGGSGMRTISGGDEDATKNKYNTRRNHIISVIWMCVLAALLTAWGLWEVSRHEEFDTYLNAAIRGADGMVRCYAVGSAGQCEEIESFDGSTVEIWEGGADMYEAVYEEGVKRLRLKNPHMYRDGEEVKIPSAVMAVLTSVEEVQISVRNVWVYRDGELYFLGIEPQERLWRPSVFFYYNGDSGELVPLFEFDEGEVIGFGLSETFKRDMGI